jgi:hypothetical protein
MLGIFTNLETLELPLTEKQVVPGLQEMLESLPKLTSLLTRAFAGDMSKLTALKNLSLQSETKEERNIDITNFPPNLEHFSCISEMIKCDFPTSIKSVYIGRIVPEFQSNIIEINKKQFASMTAAAGKLRMFERKTNFLILIIILTFFRLSSNSVFYGLRSDSQKTFCCRSNEPQFDYHRERRSLFGTNPSKICQIQ